MYLGDFQAGDNVELKFTTVDATGVPYALAGSPAISVYKDTNVTQSTAGVTLTTSFDSVTGLNHVTVDLSADGSFYAAAHDFQVVITTGTVNSASVVGYVVAHFSIANRPVIGATIGTGGIAASSFAASAIDAAALAADAVDEIWDELIADSTITSRQALRVYLSALVGLLSGVSTNSPVFRNVADTKNVITATTTSDGRTVVTLNP